MMARLLLLLAVGCAVGLQAEEDWVEDYHTPEPLSYKGHSLVRFAIESDATKAAFDTAVAKHGLDVWGEAPGKHSIARVPPMVQLTQLGFEHTVLNKDIAPLLLLEKKPAGNGFHQRYHSAKEIEAFVQQLAKKYPKVVRTEHLGKSVKGQPITAVHISAGTAKDLPTVFVQAGQHAREWIGPAASMVMLETMAKEASGAKSFDYQVTVVPLVNPDGYQFTHDSDRMWRKNRDNPTKTEMMQMVDEGMSAELSAKKCVGVDLNRNWNVHWSKTKKNNQVIPDKVKPCSETYPGTSAATEPEVVAVSKHIKSRGNNIKAFMDVHSYSQRLLPPGCNGFKVKKEDAKEHERVGKQIVDALSKRHGQHYETGPCGEEMYVCSGTAGDWTYQEQNIVHSFSLELRPTQHGTANGFVLPPDQIQATGEELIAGVDAMAKGSIHGSKK